MVTNETYDNDDNPYGEFKLHLYTNMRDINGTLIYEDPDQFDDRVIPLVECSDLSDAIYRKSEFKKYCPSYMNDDFLYGNFLS